MPIGTSIDQKSAAFLPKTGKKTEETGKNRKNSTNFFDLGSKGTKFVPSIDYR
jgi:hypothetical protein